MANIKQNADGSMSFVDAGGNESARFGGLSGFVASPMPAPVLAAIGDSRIAQGFADQSGTYSNINRMRHGVGSWLEFLSSGRVRFPMRHNKAVSGSQTSALDGQITNVLALSPKPTHCLILSGTNDFGAGLAAAAAEANILAAWARLKSAGIQPVHVLDLPRTLASWIAADANQSFQFNQWLRDYATLYGVVLIDPIAAYADPASSSGDPLAANVVGDGIHPSVVGAWTVDKLIWTYFQTLPLPSIRRQGSRGESYDATNNPRGNLLTNPFFTGTTGTNTAGTGAASGTVGDLWNNRIVSGTGASVASIVARTDGGAGNWQQLAVTDTSGGTQGRFSLITAMAPASGYAVGDTVRGEVDIDVSSATGLQYVQLNLFDFGTGNQATSVDGKPTIVTSVTYPLPATFTGRLRTDDIVISSGSTNLHWRLEWQLASGGSATIKIGGAECRKVIAQ